MSGNVVKFRTGDGTQQARITRAVREASLDAEQIVAKARAEAEDLLAKAERQSHELLESSRQRGLEEGLNRWNQNLVEAFEAREQFLARNEAELVKLAVAVARKVVGECAASDNGAVLLSVREAVRSVRSERKIRLRVRASDEAVVKERLTELRALSSGIAEIAVTADDAVELGGCIVESDLGVIDAQFSTQLDALERALLRGNHAGGH